MVGRSAQAMSATVLLLASFTMTPAAPSPMGLLFSLA